MSAPPAPSVRSETVEVPVPVVRKLAPELVRDCEPRFAYPAGDLTVAAIVDRLEAVEDALAICRNEKALIREAQQ